MKKMTKTVARMIAFIAFVFVFNACQEDVYPDLENQELVQEQVTDEKSDTEDVGEDDGLDPR